MLGPRYGGKGFKGGPPREQRSWIDAIVVTYGDLTLPRPPVWGWYEGKRLRSSPEEIREAYEEIRRRWSGRG